MKKYLIKSLLTLLALIPAAMTCAEEVSVNIQTDPGFDNSTGIVQRMEHNLSKVLSEINTAYSEKRRIVFSSLPMNDFSKKTLAALWDNLRFVIDDTEVIERCWPLKNGYMMRQIPLIVSPKAGPQDERYQEATVEFDKNGQIV